MLNNYIIFVDSHKFKRKEMSEYRKSLMGRYRVGADSEKEALKIIRRYLGKFGSPRIYYKCKSNDIIAKKNEIIIEFKYGEEMFQSGDKRNISNSKFADYFPYSKINGGLKQND